MARWQIHRRDANHEEIVAALEQAGATVYPIDRPVDLLVGVRGVNYLLEVKTKRGKPEPRQVSFFLEWRGAVTMVRSIEEALRAVGLLS